MLSLGIFTEFKHRYPSWNSENSFKATCGPAIRHRTRACFGPSAFYICNEGLVEVEPCETLPCDGAAVAFTFSEWTNWAFCSESCGLGERSRTRRCEIEIVKGLKYRKKTVSKWENFQTWTLDRWLSRPNWNWKVLLWALCRPGCNSQRSLYTERWLSDAG